MKKSNKSFILNVDELVKLFMIAGTGVIHWTMNTFIKDIFDFDLYVPIQI